MKTYRIRILVHAGTQRWIEETIIAHLASSSGTNYQFVDDDNRWKYYPVANTIVEQLEDLIPNL
jgi:hypothetical protein